MPSNDIERDNEKHYENVYLICQNINHMATSLRVAACLLHILLQMGRNGSLEDIFFLVVLLMHRNCRKNSNQSRRSIHLTILLLEQAFSCLFRTGLYTERAFNGMMLFQILSFFNCHEALKKM